MGGDRVMLPLWWPRTACIYCGARIILERGNDAARRRQSERHRAYDPRWLACDRHAPLVACDPLTAP